MNHVQQPPRSNLCGHACLAMLLGVTLEEAIERMGHRRSTRTRELVAALGDRALDTRLIPVRQRPLGASWLAILKLTWNGSWRSHFVIHRPHPECPSLRMIHDPSFSEPFTMEGWKWKTIGGRVTSSLRCREVS